MNFSKVSFKDDDEVKKCDLNNSTVSDTKIYDI